MVNSDNLKLALFYSFNIYFSGNELSVLLVQMMMCMQGVRRLIECIFISVFSNGAIHPVQYCWGLVYYVLVGLTVHCEGPLLGTKGMFLIA